MLNLPKPVPAQKMVFAYEERGRGGFTAFSLCPLGYNLKLDLRFLVCHKELGDFSGKDVATADCKCQAMDASDTCCPAGHNGVQVTVTTEPGHHYYVLAMARPPDSGDSPINTFKLGVNDASGAAGL